MSYPDAIILPMDDAVSSFFEQAARMQTPDYDFDEITRMCLDALAMANYYPNTLGKVLAGSRPSLNPSPYAEMYNRLWSDEDILTFNMAITSFYTELRKALAVAGCYDSQGVLAYPYFTVHNNQSIVVSRKPIV